MGELQLQRLLGGARGRGRKRGQGQGCAGVVRSKVWGGPRDAGVRFRLRQILQLSRRLRPPFFDPAGDLRAHTAARRAGQPQGSDDFGARSLAGCTVFVIICVLSLAGSVSLSGTQAYRLTLACGHWPERHVPDTPRERPTLEESAT